MSVSPLEDLIGNTPNLHNPELWDIHAMENLLAWCYMLWADPTNRFDFYVIDGDPDYSAEAPLPREAEWALALPLGSHNALQAERMLDACGFSSRPSPDIYWKPFSSPGEMPSRLSVACRGASSLLIDTGTLMEAIDRYNDMTNEERP